MGILYVLIALKKKLKKKNKCPKCKEKFDSDNKEECIEIDIKSSAKDIDKLIKKNYEEKILNETKGKNNKNGEKADFGKKEEEKKDENKENKENEENKEDNIKKEKADKNNENDKEKSDDDDNYNSMG